LLFVHALEYKRIKTGSKEKVGEGVSSVPARKMLPNRRSERLTESDFVIRYI
jgi:hypothetical protein